MATSQQIQRNSFKWSFTPLFAFLNILGIPANALWGSSRVLKFALTIPIFLSLSLNFTFNIFNILNETFNCCFFNSELASHNLLILVHNYFIRAVIIPVFELWVAGWFVFHLYVTRRYHKIWTSLQKMEQEMVLNAHFYRRCRNRCIFLIAFAFLELAVCSYFKRLSKTNYFSLEKIYEGIYADNSVTKSRLSYNWAINDTISLGIGIWVRSSGIALRTMFCVFVWISSLLAEEFDKMIQQERISLHEKEETPLIMEKRLNQFYHFHTLVEKINFVFSPIVAIFLSSNVISFAGAIYRWLVFFQTPDKWTPEFSFEQSEDYQLGDLLCLISIVGFCQRLETKSERLRNNLSWVKSSFNSEKQLKLGTMALQISVQPKIKITALDIFDVDLSFIVTIIGISISYGAIIADISPRVMNQNSEVYFFTPEFKVYVKSLDVFKIDEAV